MVRLSGKKVGYIFGHACRFVRIVTPNMATFRTVRITGWIGQAKRLLDICSSAQGVLLEWRGVTE